MLPFYGIQQCLAPYSRGSRHDYTWDRLQKCCHAMPRERSDLVGGVDHRFVGTARETRKTRELIQQDTARVRFADCDKNQVMVGQSFWQRTARYYVEQRYFDVALFEQAVNGVIGRHVARRHDHQQSKRRDVDSRSKA